MRINLMDNAPLIKSNEYNSKNSTLPNSITKDPKLAQKIKDAENVSKEFETIYLDMMLKSMRQTAKECLMANTQNSWLTHKALEFAI